jgi:magnesium-dependent phosphatase 1
MFRYPEMYMLDGGAPFRRDASGAVFDAAGERIKLLGDTLKVGIRCQAVGSANA